MKRFMQIWKPAVVGFIILTFVCGVVYPGVVTIIAGVAFQDKANGSIIEESHSKVGSKEIGQTFTKPEYLIGRAASDGAATNLSPTSAEQKQLVEKRIAWWQKLDPKNNRVIPMDLVTASASGVDPDISKEAAAYQVDRISRVRGISTKVVKEIIDEHTSERLLGFWGEPTVNVLQVNLALDNLKR
ncbi:potassium-transporting ATPase subunit KdpC [Listeria ivanovii]|uniref:potassium-transporting ATPase subunit KdpC n=1 Tax=Listeria ivanovii TaxID=1638 RepID=UPI00065E601B|nr:potassium-transporting ATPase subunit KdpC [Listeria ivanovii]PZF87396.1 potassium-transporting ATPase subunit KdpC [Listeria ivanovii]PZF92426.1 potassium-transporting ATPase subunit KdpC [Listeria ivanovii]PZG03540.1 potassium-transporting ATPase subunit KdpC [Listeria ivanovii]PZG07783.1 potassium-transporting ATPase subunit KdpC [Listeria ivanovii]PZG24680.1 potassium-transporting ATPase subunit KdpC [Listeria ivanovii]